MLRIITQSAEVHTELQRIRHRIYDDAIQQQEAAVKKILETVKDRGDLAFLEDLEPPLNPKQLRVSGSELDAAYQQISKDLLDAIRVVCQQLKSFHQQRLPKSWVKFEEDEVVIAKRYAPLKRAGLYVAGDRGSHISRVLMQAIPAQVAQVPQIVLVTPPDATGKIHPNILVAAQEAGVQEIYRLGGAAAIAALAYGTESLPKVDVITGTGDLEITLAKKMVYGTIALDTTVQSSDLMIIADRQANSTQIAADLLAQVEQDPTTAIVLLTPDFGLAEAVQEQVLQQLQQYSPSILTEKAIAHYGLIIVVDSLGQAIALANQFVPQYLMLAMAEPWDFVDQIRHAGTILMGSATPKAIADYLGNSGMILPPSGIVRYASTLGVETFLKPSNLIQYSPTSLKKLSDTLQLLAEAEGFLANTEAIRLRFKGESG
ncbi:Histidinol dehydrogenase [Rippkaea orientalis PCC 8801]|uniref:Histidinol dehydrogenase n=1 Tax=Rippkaea orientalis (strain PCC 8801 / RF-1) TaxID=41431 RepID=B7K4Z7_RIPO1|nr:histidinol dehydrogenase [Rippkaea orientalis]ACK66653.1 Histidinol dehydrogenase [Rippkaea orientalis PCC 8801]